MLMHTEPGIYVGKKSKAILSGIGISVSKVQWHVP